MKWADIPAKYKPHWTSWKIEGTPFERTQKMLHAKGLHDPWLRNEVWVYGIKPLTLTGILRRGILSGFVVFLGALAVERTFFSDKYGDDHH